VGPVTLVSGPSPFTGGCAGAQPGTIYRNAEVEPWVAVNPANANDFVGGWQQDSWSNGGAIAFAKSTAGGLTWSAPVRISQNANTQAFTAAIAVAADGTIGVTWRETHVSGAFDHTVAPNAGGYFLGDYAGLAAVGRDFVAFFAQANTGNIDNAPTSSARGSPPPDLSPHYPAAASPDCGPYQGLLRCFHW
jgi:hypothetical protein